MPGRPVCTFTLDTGQTCGKRPPVADYYRVDALRGTVHEQSLCAEHDTKEAEMVAKRDGLERRTP